MRYGRFFTHRFKEKRPDFNVVLWVGYIGWWANYNLSQMPGSEPRWISWILGLIPTRGYTDVRDYYGKKVVIGPDRGHFTFFQAHFRAWWFGWLSPLPKRLGNFLTVRYRRHGHRCDWVDLEDGLLYGGSGESMNKAFDEFIGEILPTAEQEKNVKLAVDELIVKLAEDGHEIN